MGVVAQWLRGYLRRLPAKPQANATEAMIEGRSLRWRKSMASNAFED